MEKKVSTRKMTDEELLQILRDYNDNVGFPTQRKFLARNGLPSSVTYFNRFGSFSKAIELAGIEIPEGREKDFGRVELPDEVLLSGLKKFVEEVLKVQLFLPTSEQILECPYIQSNATYFNRFGTLDNAFSLIGYNKEEFNNKRLEEDMLKKYKELYNILGRVPSSKDLNKYSLNNNYYYSTSSYINHFGSISNTKILCGFECKPPKFLQTRRELVKSEDEMLQDLRELYVELGRLPVQSDVDKKTNITATSRYISVFGSISNAFKLAGLKPNSRVYITNKGNKCLSSLEYKFTKILENYNIPFQKEVYYSSVILNFDRRYRFDYVIELNGNKYYIEIFGITGNEKYEKRKNKKIQLCKDNNVPLVTFEYNDFWSNTNEKLYELLLEKIFSI